MILSNTKSLNMKVSLILWQVSMQSYRIVKRSIDMSISLLLLILLSPLFMMVALLIRVESSGSVLFSQTRIGMYGREFKFWKFRSMRMDAEHCKSKLTTQGMSNGVRFKMKKDPRITRVGAIIRKFSIDELPQLWNVLIGDMSLVGPRPALPSEVASYSLQDKQRLNVMQGITCIWQVSGRSELSFEEQVQLDVQYSESLSIFQDLKLLFLTVPAVITGKGAY